MEYMVLIEIVVISYLSSKILRLMKVKKKYISTLTGIIGGIVGVVTYYISPEMMNIKSPVVALAIGIVSGLASTKGEEKIKEIIRRKKE